MKLPDHAELSTYSLEEILLAVGLLARARPTDDRLRAEVRSGLKALEEHLVTRGSLALASHLIQQVVDEYADLVPA